MFRSGIAVLLTQLYEKDLRQGSQRCESTAGCWLEPHRVGKVPCQEERTLLSSISVLLKFRSSVMLQQIEIVYWQESWRNEEQQVER